MKYFAFHIKCGENQKELLLAYLNQLEFESFEERDSGWVAYLPSTVELSNYRESLARLKNQIPFSYEVTEVEDQNWNALWESQFKPVLLEGFCHIRGTFHPPADKSIPYELIIDPRMAFGTGHHATTYMMMEQMQDLEFAKKKILDFGCGTGILSILAEKMGARKVIAIDNDPKAIENTREHMQLNNCYRIEPKLATLEELSKSDFDLILANINRSVLFPALQTLYNMLRPGGNLLLSGILEADKQKLNKKGLETGFTHHKTIAQNAWICSLFQKPE